MGAWLLAFDTSTEVLAVALAGPGGDFSGHGPGGPAASANLLPRAAALLAEAGIGWSALDAIAFGAGPGAFTGLRTACAVAQGLGLGLGRPLLPVCSLSIVAEDARAQATAGAGFEVWAAVDARMNEVYAAAFAFDGTRWHPRAAPALYTLAALGAVWTERAPVAVAGNALTVFGERLPTGAARCFPQERDRAGALLRRAQALWREGAAVDAAAALPLYLRDKVALTVAERRVLRDAA